MSWLQDYGLVFDIVICLLLMTTIGYAVALAEDGESAKVMQSSPVLGQPFDSSSKEATEIASAIEAGRCRRKKLAA